MKRSIHSSRPENFALSRGYSNNKIFSSASPIAIIYRFYVNVMLAISANANGSTSPMHSGLSIAGNVFRLHIYREGYRQQLCLLCVQFNWFIKSFLFRQKVAGLPILFHLAAGCRISNWKEAKNERTEKNLFRFWLALANATHFIQVLFSYLFISTINVFGIHGDGCVY